MLIASRDLLDTRTDIGTAGLDRLTPQNAENDLNQMG
jgi:hypothetical protein